MATPLQESQKFSCECLRVQCEALPCGTSGRRWLATVAGLCARSGGGNGGGNGSNCGHTDRATAFNRLAAERVYCESLYAAAAAAAHDDDGKKTRHRMDRPGCCAPNTICGCDNRPGQPGQLLVFASVGYVLGM